MKKMFVIVIATVMSAVVSAQDVISKENGMTVVNTTSIAKDVEGYNGPTPVKIYIKKNKVVKFEMLRSQDGPKYVAKVKNAILSFWDGMTVKKALTVEPDAVTGATFTSNAVKANVKRGLEYYQKKK